MKSDLHQNENIPKALYGFNTKSINELLEIIKVGKLSKDAQNAIIYVLRNKEEFSSFQIENIIEDFKRDNENQVFENFGLLVDSENNLLLKMKQRNRYAVLGTLIVLSIFYLFFVLPYSLEKFKEQMYVFYFLIVFIPIGIIKEYLRLKEEKGFEINVKENETTLQCSENNYQEIRILNSEIQRIKLVEDKLELKLVLYYQNNMAAELLSQEFERIQKQEVIDYMNLIKNKLDKAIGIK